MVVVTGRLKVADTDRERLERAIADAVAHTVHEPGCTSYVFSRDLHDAGLFHIAEEWVDRAALDAHIRSDHYRAWSRALREMTVLERTAIVYDVTDKTVHQ